MDIETTNDIFAMLRMYIASAALGSALEFGLFWDLAEKPLRAEDISQKYKIPFNRCQRWLELLKGLSLLEQQGDTYWPSF
jgi:hypothetical protein